MQSGQPPLYPDSAGNESTDLRTKRVSRKAWHLWKYMQGVARLNGWLHPSLKFLSVRFNRSIATIKRWIGELHAAHMIETKRRGRRPPEYKILEPPIPQNDTSGQLHLFTEPLELANDLKIIAQESAAPEIEEAFGAPLSRGDAKFVADLEAASVPRVAIVAGILVGRARKSCSDMNRQKHERIFSVRYFIKCIEEAVQGAFPPGYVQHVKNWLIRNAA
jgi:hypothetical protein